MAMPVTRLVHTAAVPLLVVLSVWVWQWQEAGCIVADCTGVRCLPPLCANPVTPPGQCCLSCQNSKCHFEGCVVFENYQVHWKPEPCKTCSCVSNKVVCTRSNCTKLTRQDCFGYPVAIKMNDCCPSCNYSIPSDKCGVVPSHYHTLRGGEAELCTRDVMMHRCDKLGFTVRGKKYRCVPQEQQMLEKFPRSCPFRVVTYSNVMSCKALPDDSVNLPVHKQCDLVV